MCFCALQIRICLFFKNNFFIIILPHPYILSYFFMFFLQCLDALKNNIMILYIAWLIGSYMYCLSVSLSVVSSLSLEMKILEDMSIWDDLLYFFHVHSIAKESI